MGRPQRDLFETRQDALDDKFDLQPQMGASPPEHSTGPLQHGDLVREEVPPRRRGRITLIKSCQRLSDSTHRSGGVAVPQKDLVEWPPGSFLKDESSKVA
jgi:hypothetical protein